MKKIIIYIILTISVLSGCSLDRLPHGAMAADVIVTDPNGSLDAILNGTYAQMKKWSDAQHRSGEYAGDNMMIRSQSSDAFFEFVSYSRTPDNYRLEYMWNDSYKVIAQTSNIIKLVKEGQNVETDHKLGECYFLRGMMYFYLCRTFGRPYYQSPETSLGVPIVNGTPEDMTNVELPDRSTVKEVYAQAISDLTKSAEMMTENNGPSFASKGAANALLSRVYLFMSGTWANPNREYADLSIVYANKVINSGEYSLLSREEFMKYNTIVPENNDESIFVVKQLASEAPDLWNSVGGMYSNVAGQGWGEMFASAKYLDLLGETGVNNFYTREFVDARAAFIDPVYQEKRIFRYIQDVYNKADVHTGYLYKQVDLDRTGGIVKFTEDASTYTLAPVISNVNPVSTASDSVYNFTHKDGKTYTGVIDNYIKLNVGQPEFYIVKCSREGEESQLHSPVISRLAEIYLNKAEAEAKMGDYPAAKISLNIVRERSIPGAGYTILASSNAATLIENERQLELAYQAERSYDVYRNGGTLTREYPGFHDAMEVVTPDDYRVIYFIPQSAINAYAPNVLTQNPIN